MNNVSKTLQFVILLFVLSVSVNAFAGNNTNPSDSPEKYSKVKIFAGIGSDIKKINDSGLFFDHAEVIAGEYIET